MATFGKARSVKREHSPKLLGIAGVCGVDVQEEKDGSGTIVVHLNKGRTDVLSEIPKVLDGVKVKTMMSGPFEKR